MAYDHPRRDTIDSTDFELRMSGKGDQYSSQTAELHERPKSYVSPSIQDEYQDEQRPARMPSPPMSEASNPPWTEQQTGLSNVSDELIAHLTQRITEKGEFGPVIYKPRKVTNLTC